MWEVLRIDHRTVRVPAPRCAGWEERRRWRGALFIPWIVGLSVTLCALLGCVVALEAALRVTGLQPPFLYRLDDQVCATHIPGLATRIVTDEYASHVSFNSVQ